MFSLFWCWINCSFRETNALLLRWRKTSMTLVSLVVHSQFVAIDVRINGKLAFFYLGFCHVINWFLRKVGRLTQKALDISSSSFFLRCQKIFIDRCLYRRLKNVLVHLIFLDMWTQNNLFPISHVSLFSRIGVCQFFGEFPLTRKSRSAVHTENGC